jgi:hypothetical protein
VKFHLIFIFVLLTLPASQLNAEVSQHNWPCQPNTADCIGSVKLQVDKSLWPKAKGIFEITSFTNGEWLFVNLTTDPIVKIFKFPEIHEIYYEIRTTEEEQRQRNIFQQGAGQVLVSSMELIFKAHPGGLNAMPSNWITREVEIEGKKIQASVRKISSKSFEFSLLSDPDWKISGLWSIEKVQPWQDSYSLDGWLNQSQVASFRTLGDLREKIRKSWQR